jgi:hypothetical protein
MYDSIVWDGFYLDPESELNFGDEIVSEDDNEEGEEDE